MSEVPLYCTCRLCLDIKAHNLEVPLYMQPFLGDGREESTPCMLHRVRGLLLRGRVDAAHLPKHLPTAHTFRAPSSPDTEVYPTGVPRA